MSEITVTRPHSFPPDEAKRRVERVVDELRGKYPITAEWDGDSRMSFEAMGVSGNIEIRSDEIAVAVDKSFWVPISDDQLEGAINKALDKGLA
jgi:putative polyhydroxyalkanoate system protein